MWENKCARPRGSSDDLIAPIEDREWLEFRRDKPIDWLSDILSHMIRRWLRHEYQTNLSLTVCSVNRSLSDDAALYLSLALSLSRRLWSRSSPSSLLSRRRLWSRSSPSSLLSRCLWSRSSSSSLLSLLLSLLLSRLLSSLSGLSRLFSSLSGLSLRAPLPRSSPFCLSSFFSFSSSDQ